MRGTTAADSVPQTFTVRAPLPEPLLCIPGHLGLFTKTPKNGIAYLALMFTVQKQDDK